MKTTGSPFRVEGAEYEDQRPFSPSRKWLLIAGVLFASVMSLGMFGNGEAQPADTDSPPVSTDERETQQAAGKQEKKAQLAVEDEAKHLVAKLIPNLKNYVNAPDTRIDARTIFSEFFDEGEDYSVAVMLNKKSKEVDGRKVGKYVDALIEGDELVLKWKKIGKTEIRLRAVSSENAEKYVDCKFDAEAWIADFWKLAFTVIGGLGLFLLGMKSMSDGLQAVAGNGLRRMIGMATDNRFMAVIAGTIATMVVQSSSITTVMVVGFVNSGFMYLAQAIGVIMGANIGTTITGWILALKIGKFGLPIMGVCVFGYLFSRNERIRFLAMFGMGLGMVFFGLEIMKNGFSMVKDLPAFEQWFQEFDASTYFGVLKCASVGCVLTFLVQSSSATLGITIGLAEIGVIPFETAAALVLGENIGTTITAWLASIGTTTNAKRAAYFHVIFNILGVIWITALFGVYLPCVEYVVKMMGGGDKLSENFDITAAIAAVHTGFNVTNTILFVAFVPMFARLLERFVPDRKVKEIPHLTSLDIRILETPVIAVEQSRVEILRMADGCNKMMDWLRQLMSDEEPDQKLVQKLFHREEVLDTVQDEIVSFMTHLLAGNVPHSTIEEGRRQLRMADEYESISDYIASILKFRLKLRNQGHRFDTQQREDILKLHDMVAEYLRLVSEAYEHRRPEVITKAHSMGDEVKHRVKGLRKQLLEDLTKERIEPFVNVAYTSTLNSYRRVRDHAINVAEALAGEK